MNIKYSYVTKSTNPLIENKYHGPFQVDIEDFINFMNHLPKNVECIYLKLKDGKAFTYNEYTDGTLWQFADYEEETPWL